MSESPVLFTHNITVRFKDLDPMGHAHHSLPLVYIEEARATWWREVVGHARLEGIDYIMARVQLEYSRRIEWPSDLVVIMRAGRIGNASFDLDYELRDAAGELLTTARTTQVMFDYTTGRSKPITPEVRAALGASSG